MLIHVKHLTHSLYSVHTSGSSFKRSFRSSNYNEWSLSIVFFFLFHNRHLHFPITVSSDDTLDHISQINTLQERELHLLGMFTNKVSLILSFPSLSHLERASLLWSRYGHDIGMGRDTQKTRILLTQKNYHSERNIMHYEICQYNKCIALNRSNLRGLTNDSILDLIRGGIARRGNHAFTPDILPSLYLFIILKWDNYHSDGINNEWTNHSRVTRMLLLSSSVEEKQEWLYQA